MTVINDIDKLTKMGCTPKKRREPSGNNRSTLFRLPADGVMNGDGAVSFGCPYCGCLQAFRPAPGTQPAMDCEQTTKCCMKNVRVHIAGRVCG